jgi:anti-anti-sigma factor
MTGSAAGYSSEPGTAVRGVEREVTAVTDANEIPFWVRREEEQSTAAVVVRAGGEFDAITAEQLDKHLVEAEDAVAPPEPVLLDLSEVTYLSSAGVATLIIHTQRCAQMGSRLCVVADQPAVVRPIVLCGADSLIDIAPTFEEATARSAAAGDGAR